MTIRSYDPSDLEELKRIHKLYFDHESDVPDFMNCLCAFTVEDEKGIITFGAVRDIAEAITVTDKSRSARDRAKALYQILDASTFVSKTMGFDRMYAWSQNPKWAYRLQKTAGFRPHRGQSLILDL